MRGSGVSFGQLDICGGAAASACWSSPRVGAALIAGVSSVGASIRQAVERDAAVLMGGDIGLMRGDAPRLSGLAAIASFGRVVRTIDTNVRAEAATPALWI